MDNNLLSVEESRLLQLLNDGLITADRFINKNYLINLSERNVNPLDEEKRSTSPIRLFEIEKLVYDKDENVNDKLISVYSALQNVNSSAVLIIDGSGKEVKMYIGVRAEESAAVASTILAKGFEGNFAGSTLRSLKNKEVAKVLGTVKETEHLNSGKNVSCVTVVPSMRDDDKEKFVQGIEKYIDTMKGERYTAILIATPVSKKELEQRKRGFEELYSSLSPLHRTTFAYGENFSKAVSSGTCENFAKAVNNSVTNTTGRNVGSSKSISDGTSESIGYELIFERNRGKSHTETSGYSSGQSWSKAVTEGVTDTRSTGSSLSDTKTEGDNRTLTVEHINKSVEVLMNQINEQLERIDACEAFGVWECAAYFIAEDIQTSVVAANSYKALMLGDNTSVENAFVNVWSTRDITHTTKILDYLQYCIHPQLEISPEQGYEKQIVSPANVVSGKELPLIMGLPHKSVSGIAVSNIAEFGRNVYSQNKQSDQTDLPIGKVHHMGANEEKDVCLNLNSFASHCFITGSTGSGKSNTTYCLIERFIENGIPFLVIEPAKGEYKDAFGNLDGLNIFSTNPLIGEMLKINPFRFDPQIHILEHLDRLIEIFNACWEMYAAMPAIMKDAVERVYVEKGWDLLNSIYLNDGEPEYPTFCDLMNILPEVIDKSQYSSETKGNYTGALVTRVTSLATGISGQIFCDDYDVPDRVLFDENTIVDLSRVGSNETKSLIMGILVLKISEYRMANAQNANSELKHITIIEEAHNLLKRTSPTQEGSNLIGKSVEMICNSIAEMRTYGEGFVIVDQSPTSVDVAAIKNTNTKIIMRLPERADCEAVANAVSLNEEQTKEISKLATGIAVVMQNNWLEAVLTNIFPAESKYEKIIQKATYNEIKELRSVAVKEMIDQYVVEKNVDFNKMQKQLKSCNANIFKKDEMEKTLYAMMNRLGDSRDNALFGRFLVNISGAQNLFDIINTDLLTGEFNDKGNYSRESIENWKKQYLKLMQKYVNIPENYMLTALKFMMLYESIKDTSINYNHIYESIFARKQM